MLAHDSAHSRCCFFGVVKWNRGAEVMNHMATDNSMENVLIYIEGSKAKASIDSSRGSEAKGPARSRKMREGRICMLEIGDCN